MAGVSFINLINAVVGLLLLLAGRRLYWFFVGAIGFIAGISVTPMLLPAQPDWMVILVGIIVGLLGALLAVFLQGLAIGLAGFVGGGYLVLALLDILNANLGQLAWIPVLVGAIIGVILVGFLFNWALILLSSLVGSGILVQTLDRIFEFGPGPAAILFLILLVVGIVVQTISQPRARPEPRQMKETD